MSFKKIRKAAEKVDDKLHKERLDRCIPVARELIKLVASKADTIALGDVPQTHESFDELALDILKLFLEKNVNWVDKEFIFQIALQPMTFAQNIAIDSLSRSWNTAVSGLFKKNFAQLTMADVDEKLRVGDEVEGNVV